MLVVCKLVMLLCHFTDSKPNVEVLYHENFDMDSIVTPVNADQFEKLLKESSYDPEETRFLVNGFKSGFSIGFEGNR